MLYILERRPTYSRILAGKVSSPSLPSCPIASMALARAAAESALRSLSGSLDLPATSKRVAPLRFASAMARSESCTITESVSVKSSRIFGKSLLHVCGHAHAGAAAVRLERLHEGQEPLRVVDLELEVRHGALAHGPLELGRVHVGARVPELVGVHAAAAEDGVLGELHHLLGDHAPSRLELPPLAVLELHEACHEGAAGEAVGSVAAEVLEGHGQLAQDAVPRLLQIAVRPPLFERSSLRRRVGRRAQLQLGVKRGHQQREELGQLLVGAGPEVVDHAGQARGEDVHAVHEPQRFSRPESEAGCAASVFERGRLCGFGLGARPAVRLRSWSEAGWAASVLERGRLRGFGFV